MGGGHPETPYHVLRTHPKLSRLELILLEILQVLLFIPSLVWMLSEIPAEVTPFCSIKALSIFSPSLFSSSSLFFFFPMDIKNQEAYLESRQLWAGVAG